MSRREDIVPADWFLETGHPIETVRKANDDPEAHDAPWVPGELGSGRGAVHFKRVAAPRPVVDQEDQEDPS